MPERGTGDFENVEPPLSAERLEQIYRTIIESPTVAFCDAAGARAFVEEVAEKAGPAGGEGLRENFLRFLERDPSPKDLWQSLRGMEGLLLRNGLEMVILDHNERVVGGTLPDFTALVNGRKDGSRTVVFVSESPYFVILREAMYLRHNGHRAYLATVNPISGGLIELFERHFDGVIHMGGSAPMLHRLLGSLEADIFHVQCGMWTLYLGRLVIESKGPAKVVCEFYDITSVYADRDVLCSNWSAAMVDLDMAMERYIFHEADAIVHRFPREVIGALGKKYGAMPPEIVMYAYACPEFTAYGDEKPSARDDVIRMVYAGTTIPVNEAHPPWLFPETGMPEAFRRMLEQGFAIDILHDPHAEMKKDSPERAQFTRLAEKFPRFGMFKGVSPDRLSQTLAPYDYGILLMDFDMSVIRIGEYQRRGIVATKIFAYLEAGLPVIVNREYEEMARIVTEYGLGLAVHSSELGHLAGMLEGFDYTRAVDNIRRFNEDHGMPKEIPRLIALYDEIR